MVEKVSPMNFPTESREDLSSLDFRSKTSSMDIDGLPLPTTVEYKHVETKENGIVLKAKLNSCDAWVAWLKDFEVHTSTSWILLRSKPESQRLVCRRDYMCHHSSITKRVTSRKSKKLNCKASLCVKIWKNPKDGFPSEITINNDHSHPIHNAEVLSALPAPQSLKNTFEQYFDNGMGVTEAINLHVAKLELECCEEDLASGSINPKYRSVRYWHDTWRTLHLGPRTGEGVIEKLKEKQGEYEKVGTQVVYEEDPFTVVCMTKLMNRAHMFASDIVFVDSTASCDAEHHTLTLMLTCTEAGAVPLAVIITKGQSMVEYECAFKIVRDMAGQDGFGGKGFPKLFMTDDSDAEKGALKNVFPESKLLLCAFHVRQSVWRWLCAKEHNICKEDRQHLYRLFQDILTASSETTAENYFFLLETDEVCCKYVNWKQYMGAYWSSRSSWCLAFRDATTHGNQTNNFSETAVRIYKDIILSRCKAYNAISLVDFTCIILENYYTRRLRNYAHGRVDSNRLLFDKISKRSGYLTLDKINQTDSCHFVVPSEKDDNVMYHIDLLLGSCSCEGGRLGKLCKHIVGVYSILLHQHSIENRYKIAQLALGDKANSKEFYQPMQTSLQAECSIEVSTDPSSPQPPSPTATEVPSTSQAVSTSELQLDEFKEDQVCSMFYKKYAQFGFSQVRVRKGRAAIRVQPAALMRRRPGVTRGSKRLSSGRPAEGCPSMKKKRPHKLSVNVSNNVNHTH